MSFMLVLSFLKVAFGHLFPITSGLSSVLSIGCYSCLLDATLVSCMLVLSFLKVAFGHPFFDNPVVIVLCCQSCLLDAALVCCVLVLTFLKVAFVYLFCESRVRACVVA